MYFVSTGFKEGRTVLLKTDRKNSALDVLYLKMDIQLLNDDERLYFLKNTEKMIAISHLWSSIYLL